jgi:hypothetical protein
MRVAAIILVLLAILAGAIFVGHYGWVSAGDVAMPTWGWLMMGLGIVFTLLVGGGLMALIFYSSRAGFDEAPEFETNPAADQFLSAPSREDISAAELDRLDGDTKRSRVPRGVDESSFRLPTNRKPAARGARRA